MAWNKLFIKIILLAFLTFGTIGLIFLWNPYQKEDLETAYSASIIDKFHRLDSLKSPKIVLLAGSNFAYGINSEMIEQQLQMPVVNMAIHYNLGTDFMLRSIENKLHSGDIVITGFEYIVSSQGEAKEKLLVASFFPIATEWISYKNLKERLSANLSFYISQFRLIVRRWVSNEHFRPKVEGTYDIFFRKGFNQYGDLISHLNNPPVKEIPASIIDESIDLTRPIEDMNVFTKKMSKKGVKVYYIYPPYAASGYQKDQQIIKKLQSQFDSLAQFKVLGKPQTFVYSDSLFQDMVYHLNAKGRNVRTQQLINLMKTELAK